MKKDQQEETPWRFQRGQSPWNKGTGGCKRGHDPSFYKRLPSGVFVCLACKRENGAKYRNKNRKSISLKNRVRRYNISYEDFKFMWELQKGCCPICGVEFKNEDSCRIDHDHATGKVRGLLCPACNTGIGLLKDSPDILIKASEYLNEQNRG